MDTANPLPPHAASKLLIKSVERRTCCDKNIKGERNSARLPRNHTYTDDPTQLKQSMKRKTFLYDVSCYL